MADKKDDKFDELLLMWMAYQTVRAEEAQDLKDDWYTVEEIADELDMDIRQDYVDMEELAKHVDLLVPIINKGRGNI